jgi:hypothetical protein
VSDAARPTPEQIADRALVLYALVRRATIELALESFDYEPMRIRQAESARAETDRWLQRESLDEAVLGSERRLLDADSGTWPREAVMDTVWRKEGLAVLLWSLQHTPSLPPMGDESEMPVLDAVITRYGSVSSFRANGMHRDPQEVEEAWLEADAWFAAAEGRGGEDATVASIAAERFRALSWLRDASAPPP